MKTFGEFQEAAAAVKALPTIVKAFTKVAPMVAPKLQTFAKFSTAVPVGLAGAAMLQAKKGRPEGGAAERYKKKNPNKKRKLSRMAEKQIEIENRRGEQVTNIDPFKGMIKPKPGEVRKTEALIRKHEKLNKIIKPKEGDITKEKELLKQKQKEITQPKTNEKKEASKTVKDYLKARKKEGETAYRIKQDAEIADKGPGDLLPTARKRLLDRLLSKNKNSIPEEAAIVNSLGRGKIAGTVEAGDDPPVKKNKRGSGMKNRKKKKYAYGGRGSRKMWMT